MAVRHWSRVGLMLTDACTAACASCYLRCRPRPGAWMNPDMALGVWRGLHRLSPHGCRAHLTGGEPFMDWPRLVQIARAARAEGLELEAVETNAFWATDEAVIRDRLRALDEAGMRRLTISADPFHQEFVPLEHVRRLARVAEETLGADRVRVRWRDWMDDGRDTAAMTAEERQALYAMWIAKGRDRLNGRAADALAGLLPCRPADAFTGPDCREVLLRGKHVHVLPSGVVMPGVCAGLTLGTLEAPWEAAVETLWRRLVDDGDRRPILDDLILGGPTKLMMRAVESGFTPSSAGYASKCHLCWSVRRHLAGTEGTGAELGPTWLYER